MSDEEKEAIENLKEEFDKHHFLPDICNEDLGIVLNLIEKQQKELNKEKEKNKEYEEGTMLSKKQTNMVLQAIKEGATEQITKEMKNYIHKDKIRELKNISIDYLPTKIDELLNE